MHYPAIANQGNLFTDGNSRRFHLDYRYRALVVYVLHGAQKCQLAESKPSFQQFAEDNLPDDFAHCSNEVGKQTKILCTNDFPYLAMSSFIPELDEPAQFPVQVGCHRRVRCDTRAGIVNTHVSKQPSEVLQPVILPVHKKSIG